ncbi:MAG: helix-turn-helix domain-containing protein, partial [Bacilli bacterium]|nr:helix-turn-helix domain-containing protein [Bacilli bacterium]
RKNKIAYARHIFVYLVKTKFDTPLTTIGKALGNRDHATIAHSHQKIKDLLISNPLTKQDIDNLTKLFE